jgi:hypothetical protein
MILESKEKFIRDLRFKIGDSIKTRTAFHWLKVNEKSIKL